MRHTHGRETNTRQDLGMCERVLAMRRPTDSHQIPEPTTDDLDRINGVLGGIGGPHVVWGAGSALDVWAIEQRARLDERMSNRIYAATRALVWATLCLVICTAGLIWATLVG